LLVSESEPCSEVLLEVCNLCNAGKERSVKLGLLVSLGLELSLLCIAELKVSQTTYLGLTFEELVSSGGLSLL